MKMFKGSQIMGALSISILVTAVATGVETGSLLTIVIANVALALNLLTLTWHKHDKEP